MNGISSDAAARREAHRNRASGEFGNQHRTAPGDLPASGSWQARREALLGDGYVEPVATRTRFDARYTGHRETWWGEKFVSAEYGHDGGSFLQMPDDNSPSMGGGEALSGLRRTYRSRYGRSGQVQLRMPSKAAMMRFHADHPKQAFDVPVGMETPDGRTIQGFVRVTPGADRTWTAEGLGFKAEDDVFVSEAVASVLESRRPTTVDLSPDALRARYLERTSSAGVQMAPLAQSSWIGSGGYDAASETMFLTMNGRTYGYKATPEAYATMMTSTSPGRTFNTVFKRNLPREQVTTCPSCQRAYVASRNHHCPGTATRSHAADAATDRVRGYARFAWWSKRNPTA